MLSINTNLSSLIAQSGMKSSTNALNQAIERMTTGYKINHASDNAANYSISTNLTTQLSAYDTAADNVAMGMDLVNYASDIISQMQDRAARLNALSTQARNGTYGSQSLAAINSEANAIMAEITRLYSNAEYNDISIFARKAYDIAPHLPRAGESGFIDETALSGAGPPRARPEYGGFIEDPHSYEQSYVDGLTAVSEVVQSDGFTKDYYKIASVQDLVKLAELTNAGVSTTGKTFILAKDIDLGAYCAEEIAKGRGGWTPIGDYATNTSNVFKGTFDGNGHTIKNLKIYRERNYQGLFGRTDSNAKILNLKVVDINIEAETYVGGLSGFANTPITNCIVTGIIKANSSIGGLIGQTDSANVKSCYTDMQVISEGAKIGGLLGTAYSTAKITNCYTNGLVKSSNNYVGGLIGYSAADIDNCFASNDIIGSERVGGLIGYALTDSNIKNCFATGDIHAYLDYAGGLVGNSYNTDIMNCYATGDVLCDKSYCAGLIGGLYDTTVEQCYSIGKVIGKDYLGGLIGYSNTNSTIINCYAESSVTGQNNVGGLTGYNAGDIKKSYATGKISGINFIGGLIGYFFTCNNGEISDSASYSEVISTNDNSSGNLIGGIIVTSNGTDFFSPNISNVDVISSKSLKSIGGAYYNNTYLSSYDISSILSKINSLDKLITSTNIQVGIQGNSSSQIEYNSNFEFNSRILKKGIDSVETFDAIVEFEKLLNEKAVQLGAVQNRLDSALESIEVNINNLTSSRSTIRDADIAEVSSTYIQQQILQQAAATLMATANQTPAIALQLI